MSSTTMFLDTFTLTQGGRSATHGPNELLGRYDDLVHQQRFHWTEHHKLISPLGEGGQGMVFLSERRGTDGFTLPVAIKIFSPERFSDGLNYEESMSSIATIAARVAQLQQDNLLDVHNFVDCNRIRMMEMEWVDGYDLARLLTNKMLDRARERVSNRRWDYINNVIVTQGREHPRLKAGIAIAVVRGCLAALAALHREGILHGDVKPSNIMLKRTGNAKLIDIGSAYDMDDVPLHRMFTPSYAAPEVLEKQESTPRSDLCSLGYVLVEMLAGIPIFSGLKERGELLETKRSLLKRLPNILPEEVLCNDFLVNFCRKLIAPDPVCRFPSAESAELGRDGAATFHRQLIKGDLASEYDNEIRLWLEELD